VDFVIQHYKAARHLLGYGNWTDPAAYYAYDSSSMIGGGWTGTLD
jgi:hypothetical protein